ncbi:RNA methyltransferase [Patescibacteria group bacterium]|nr:RNA methyltransferase [Patescibacteria group bacterium]
MEYLSNSRLNYFKKLLRGKFAKDERKVVVEGKKICLELIENNSDLIEYALINDKYQNEFKDIEIPAFLVKDFFSPQISLSNNGFDMALVINYFKLELEAPKTLGKGIYVGLENIQDPFNLGSIIRTATAFGINGIFLIGESVHQFNNKVIASSSGAVFKIPTYKIKSVEEFKSKYPKIKIYGTSSKQGTDFRKLDIKNGLILFGNEGYGIEKTSEKFVDEFIIVPIKNIDSLNLSVSCGIIISRVTMDI